MFLLFYYYYYYYYYFFNNGTTTTTLAHFRMFLFFCSFWGSFNFLINLIKWGFFVLFSTHTCLLFFHYLFLYLSLYLSFSKGISIINGFFCCLFQFNFNFPYKHLSTKNILKGVIFYYFFVIKKTYSISHLCMYIYV